MKNNRVAMFAVSAGLARTSLLLAALGLALTPVFAGKTVRVAEVAPIAIAAPSTIASAPKLDSRGDLTRLSFELSDVVPVRAFVMANPDRVIVDLPEINFQVDPREGRATVAAPAPRRGRGNARGNAATPTQPLAGVVNSYRFGMFAPGKSRVVIDLAEPARVSRAVVERGADGVTRMLIDLVRVDRATFLAAARPVAPPARVEAVPAAVVPTSGRPVIVLDAGHGGVDDGAHGPGTALEKDIVLEFVRHLGARLEKLNRYKVVMTRSTDVFVPLGDRVKIAREAGASLFVSIHADMIADEPQVSGATVYTVSDKASDAEAARVADKENQSDAAAGVDGHEDQNEVADILFDLTRRETRAYSHVFARTLVDYFKDVGRLNKNSRRSAGFRVLKAPDVPSVLLELGYLSSEKDVPNLVSADWRDKVSVAVADAVERFFKARDVARKPGTAPDDNETTTELKASFNAGGRDGAIR
jgi:N-acetylmuramoyl-L-alanine amidase